MINSRNKEFVAIKKVSNERFQIGYKVSQGQQTNGLQVYYLKVDDRYYSIKIKPYVEVYFLFELLLEFTNKEIIDYMIENKYLYP